MEELLPHMLFNSNRGAENKHLKFLTAVFTVLDFWGCPSLTYEWSSRLCGPNNESTVQWSSSYSSKEIQLEIYVIFMGIPVYKQVSAQQA